MSTIRLPKFELPTVLLAVLIHGGWLALTFWHASIPWPLLALAGGLIVAWHGSLQHEVIHGHPTGNRAIDDAIGSVPLALWLPYRAYRRSHLAHHGAAHITDPRVDPESRYRDGGSGGGGGGGGIARAQSTLAGQLLLGPPIVIARFLAGEIARLRSGDRKLWRDWAPHLLAVAAILLWLHHVDLNIATYLLAFVYPGTALSLLRSYAEHRAELDTPGRAASVESHGVLALLFLNNNLHVAHHERPLLPWYRLPGYHRRHRLRFTLEGTRSYAGYRDVVRRFAFRAHDDLIHPLYRA